MDASVTILGSGSAVPTEQNTPSSQLLRMCDKCMMIDCGEGAQITMRRLGMHIANLNYIFISHLHGDHCFGLMGIISTFGLLKRTQPLHLFAHADLFTLLQPLLSYHCKDLPFDIISHTIDPTTHKEIYYDKMLSISTIPLEHRVPCCGFLFTETHRETSPIKRYAYCADTLYNEKIIPIIENVQTLYHEATYMHEQTEKATEYGHSTALQAATIAQKSNAKQLLIGHFSAQINNHDDLLYEAKSVFKNTFLATEGKTFEL